MKTMLILLLSSIIVFWNVENFFMPGNPSAKPGWTEGRFYTKCRGISKIIFKIADREGRIPDVVAFSEVGCDTVLRRLISTTPLRKCGYRIVHFESPDHRGIDCALIYRASTMRLLESKPCHLRDSSGNILPTRDILLSIFRTAEGDTLSLLVNHHPSKVGAWSSGRRKTAMAVMHSVCDSLVSAGYGRILSIGDFNDSELFPEGRGTIKYAGRWQKIDGVFPIGFDAFREEVFEDESLLCEDRTRSGLMPKRTFIGPVYKGGISDHLPIIISIFEN